QPTNRESDEPIGIAVDKVGELGRCSRLGARSDVRGGAMVSPHGPWLPAARSLSRQERFGPLTSPSLCLDVFDGRFRLQERFRGRNIPPGAGTDFESDYDVVDGDLAISLLDLSSPALGCFPYSWPG